VETTTKKKKKTDDFDYNGIIKKGDLEELAEEHIDEMIQEDPNAIVEPDA